MGRVKLEIKKIENPNNRIVTFGKRRAGLIKKAQELSTLCDIDLALIMFSPSNKLTQYATNSRIEEILFRYANVPEAERAKRKLENLEQLNRAIKKLKGENEATNFSRHVLATKGDFSGIEEEIRQLQVINEMYQKRLSLFDGDETLLESCNYDELQQMEVEVQRTIEKVRMRKQQLHYMEYSMKNKDRLEISEFGSNAWSDRDIKLGNYLHGGGLPVSNEGHTGCRDHLSSPASYNEDPGQLSNSNQLHHAAVQSQCQPLPSGLVMCGFDMGFQPNQPYAFENTDMELSTGPTPFRSNFQQQQQPGTATSGYMDLVELDLQSNLQADSSQQ